MAPNPPRVSYQNGLLTIDANNSTLGQVLRAVQSQTGASLEMPASASGQRVVATLGPARPRDVLSHLLNGVRYDYIILGEVGDPGAVKKLILTTPTPASGTATSAQNTPPQSGAEESEDESGEAEYENQPTPQQPPFRPGMPPGRRPMPGYRPPGSYQQPPQQYEQPQPYQPPQPESNETTPPGGKTPDELLQELQQMQQQQEQMQQQLNPANRNPQLQ